VSNEESAIIVKSVIDLAHGLGLAATAEGVEDEETLRLLVDLGCDVAQGFFIAQPMKPADLVPWMLRSLDQWRHAFSEGGGDVRHPVLAATG
jgi:EAL domain-containing protein (putative c-di-GMP-specific phosphodiesterase class I)